MADVDATCQHLADVLRSALVQAPTTMPWGNRSLLIRDPDGNLVNRTKNNNFLNSSGIQKRASWPIERD